MNLHVELNSTVAQKCHGNFNLTTAFSISLTAISIWSRQFQFDHGNFNLVTAISTSLTAISISLTAISI